VLDAVLQARGVVKAYGGLRPFRLRQLEVGRGEVVTLAGLDAAQAAVLVDLLTGTTLPDEGEVIVGGENTRAIGSQEVWLAFLERFGLAGERVVLLPELTVVQNLAIPLTLSVDPIPPSIRPRVEALAAAAGLRSSTLDTRVGQASAAERARIRLGRAMAHDPAILLLEHPTGGLEREAGEAYGADLRALATSRGTTVLAATADPAFVRAAATRALAWQAASGELNRSGGAIRRLLGR
jgi:putative ABC transport system ATP-binding protein